MKTTTLSPKSAQTARFQPKKVARKKPFFPKDVRPGTLIVVEWQDGSGKSTQVKILQKLLESNGFFVHFTEWNSNPRIKPLTKKLKTEDGIFDFLSAHLPAEIMDILSTEDIKTIFTAWGEATKKQSGLKLGES